MKQVIIDTDPGIDDMAAIFFALASPELHVQAITTVYGNGPVEMSTSNAFQILHAAGRLDIPVYPGAGKPLVREPNPGWALQVHGPDAMGGARTPLPAGHNPNLKSRHAALEIIDRAMAAPGEITLITLGRLTNVALALSLEPSLSHTLAEIIIMGGAVGVPGNVSPVASANLYEDPEAASVVYASGARLVQVGLDVCNRVEINARQLAEIHRVDTPPARLLSAATPFLQEYYRRQGLLQKGDGVRYNDLPAVAYAVDPSLFQAPEMRVEIETASPMCRGQTVAYQRSANPDRPANARVCLEVDGTRLAELFTRQMVGFTPS